MTDRELLELAAKAAGIVGQIKPTADGAMWLFRDGNSSPWNPLTDDGDALRLAVKLNLLRGYIYGNEVSFCPSDYAIVEACHGDPYAATRRAIVRAAAAQFEEAM
ncbi:hypothetical protein CR152_27715 [Massilia violaceinigra]|uniref:Phage ABA sandwich domain-containing protein n=1 Tax=Massilia violaceinigra TaxID=2045208 RepID=A0A2D2DVY9_9BURK|nr:hypothetical protein CR152_27715 [Massilia violaceinigra]